MADCEFFENCSTEGDAGPNNGGGTGMGPPQDMAMESGMAEEMEAEWQQDFQMAQLALTAMALGEAMGATINFFGWKYQQFYEATDSEGDPVSAQLHFSAEYTAIAADTDYGQNPWWRNGSRIRDGATFFLMWPIFLFTLINLVTGGMVGLTSAVVGWGLLLWWVGRGVGDLIVFIGYWRAQWLLTGESDAESSSLNATATQMVALVEAMEGDMMWWAIQDISEAVFMLTYSDIWNMGMDKLANEEEMAEEQGAMEGGPQGGQGGPPSGGEGGPPSGGQGGPPQLFVNKLFSL